MYIFPFPVEPTKIVGGCIAVYENIWPNYQETIDELEKATTDDSTKIKFERAFLYDGEITNQRTNYHLSLNQAATHNEPLRKINNQFFETIFSAVSAYRSRFDIHEEIFFNEGFNVLKYQTGQEYKAHYDGATMSHRAVSPIVYLNDDYAGGELEFVNFDIKIKPKAGTLMIFPSNYAYSHIAHPVIDGTKYAIVTWLHDASQAGN